MNIKKLSIAFSVLVAACLLAALAWQKTAAQQNKPSARPQTVVLDPSKGQEIGLVYEAFLTPQQEPDEESNTPPIAPKEARSTAPSVPRKERKGRGHGVVRFTKDLSKAYVEVKIEGIKIEDIVFFHIHAGKPDVLGPVLVNFALTGDLRENFADGVFSAEITNEIIEKTADSGHGLMGEFLSGVPIVPGVPGKVRTISGMAAIAQRGELYFNLHTKGQVFFGDLRGQLLPAMN